MHYLRMIVTWIVSLESGDSFRKWVSILVKISGVLTLIGAIVWGISISVGSIAASEFLGTGSRTLVIIGTILSFSINIIVGLILVILFWNRSNKIRVLSDETHFTFLPIIVILIRLCGELSFLLLIGRGVQALLGSIFGSGGPGLLNVFLRDLMPGNINFILGVISFIVSALAGAVVLILTYFIAEQVSILTNMATDLKKIKTALATQETSEDPASD